MTDPTAPLTVEQAEQALRTWIRDQRGKGFGGCRILSEGSQCDCPLCLVDHIADRNTSDAEVQRLTTAQPTALHYANALRSSQDRVDALQAEVQRLREERAWQPMSTFTKAVSGQVLVCWSTGEFDTIQFAEYRQIMEYGEPPARGWMRLPLPLKAARDTPATTKETPHD